MSKLQKFLLKRIVKSVVQQGGQWGKIVDFYKILIDAAREEYREDNQATLNGFLDDCHKTALRS